MNRRAHVASGSRIAGNESNHQGVGDLQLGHRVDDRRDCAS